MSVLIDLTCPECGEETEIDTAELEDCATIGCPECEAEFPFELTGNTLILGTALDEEEDSDDDAGILIGEDDDEDDEEDDA